MQCRHTLKRIANLAVVAAVIFSAPRLFAEDLGDEVTPGARHGVWLNALHQILEEDPDLSARQVAALERALSPEVGEAFAADAEKKSGMVIAGALIALRESFSCSDYSSFLSRLGGVEGWLKSRVITPAAPCDCGSDDDCGPGYECKDVNCEEDPSTSHTGRCKKKDTEPVPVNPRAREGESSSPGG